MYEGGDRGWVRNLVVVWIAVLIAMMGMSLVMPFLSLYLTELRVPAGQLNLWAGLVGGANFMCAALFAPLWGTLADRFGRKPMAVRALIGLAVAVGLMGYARNVQQLLALRMLQGCFGGFVAEAIALVGTSVPRERLGSSLGFLQTAVVSGNFMGPLMGGSLSHAFGYRTTFRITGAILLGAMALILLLVRERHQAPDAADRKGVAANVRELLQVPALRWIVVAVLFSQAGMMLVNPQISLFLRQFVANPRDVDWWAGVVTAAPAISSFLMSPLWGRLGDQRGHAGVLALALAGAALVVPWAGLSGAIWHLIAVRMLMGGLTSALNPSTHSVAAHAVSQRRTAGAFSLLSSAGMLGSCVGPFLGGSLAQSLGIRPLFPMTGALLLAASLAAWHVRRLSGTKPEPSAV
jgi:DHA1 family multidrug resistance protein-like MFS transporter